VLWSGQHIELAEGLLDLFDIGATDIGRDIVAEQGMAGKFGLMARQIEQRLRQKHYDWIVVQGDTITAAAAAMAGFMNRVPVAHVEAGLRTGDLYSPFPEEFNRRVITLATGMHFAPTVAAAANLATEGVFEGVHVVGNTVVDALLYVREKVLHGYQPLDPAVAALPQNRKLVLATLHRRENIGGKMRTVLSALRAIAEDDDKLVVLPVHLNPDVRRDVIYMLQGTPNVRLLPPLQYSDFVYLLDRAWIVVSDSGGVQEEAPSFGLKVLITRDTTERPEVIESGFGRLVGHSFDAIVDGVRQATAGKQPMRLNAPNPFGDGTSAARIVAMLQRRAAQAA